MRNISAWAIRHPVTPIVLFVVLTFLGVVAFIRLPINLTPDISFPLVNVNISQPGAAPTEMETQIAQKVEGSISSIGNVRLLPAVIDPQTRLGMARVSLTPDVNLRPGAFARAEVTVSNAERAVLPQTAVLNDDKGSYVLIVNAQNKVERRAVRVSGIVQGGVTITEGIDGKEQVVATAGAFLQEGELVKPVLKDSGRS